MMGYKAEQINQGILNAQKLFSAKVGDTIEINQEGIKRVFKRIE